MSTWSGRALGAVTWACVVAVGAVLVWVVISRAGSGLVNESGAVPPTSTASSPDAGPGSSGASAPQRQATWQGDTGVVTAVCRSTEITLAGAQPEDGVVVQVLDRGPVQLVVAFRGGDAGPVTVVARCAGGRPGFSVSHAAPGAPPSDSRPGSGPEPDDPRGTGAGDG